MGIFNRGKDNGAPKRSNHTLRPEYSAKLVRWALIAVPVIAALTIFNTVSVIRASNQPEPNVISDIGEVTDVQNWAVDYMLLWLGGSGPRAGESSTPNQQALEERTSAPFDVTLPTAPVQVTSVRPHGKPVAIPIGEGGTDALWRVSLEAIVMFPGEHSSRRQYYSMDVAEHGDTYQATALPRQVSPNTQPFTATTMFTNRAEPESPLFKSADAFVRAYVTPNSGGTLGSTTSSNFVGEPLRNSPYSKATTEDLVWAKDGKSVDMNNVSPGDSVFALVTVKAEVSTATYHYMQLPVRMVVLDNNQWAVDAITDYVDINGFGSPDAEGERSSDSSFNPEKSDPAGDASGSPQQSR